MNGVVEAANKNIKKILRKMVDNYKQWYEKLPFALLGYRTTVRTSTGVTPYLLVYGTEVVIPAEVEIPSLIIIQEDELSNAEWVHNRYEQLALIDGKRMNAVCHGQLYHNIMARDFNKKVRSRQFTPGKLVLKRIFPHQDEAKGEIITQLAKPLHGSPSIDRGSTYTCRNRWRDMAKTNQRGRSQEIIFKIMFAFSIRCNVNYA
ncbi:uncharacterized protein [Nicotiana tomentosiformis]|uniref:uncharacterized protein n=1 Tax=Nicotiana tomentosiformis TaxID=4098 RepID=UPI00388C53F5